MFTSGPPEFPGLIAASVWIASGIETAASCINRPSALTEHRAGDVVEVEYYHNGTPETLEVTLG
ncbi:MAG: hypothetical protein ACREUU_09950 [Gammaproteobacteria bacterium]